MQHASAVAMAGVAAAVLLVRVALVQARARRASSSSTAAAAATTTATATTRFNLASSSGSKTPRAVTPKHALVTDCIPRDQLDAAFRDGVLKCYSEMQLPSYSRYESWTQSCYMEIHAKWTPKPEINLPLFRAMEHIQERCRAVFARWYCDLYGLEEVEVTTLNSFVTKYIAREGKNEFGKHVDGVKVEGSLVLALPTDADHDWPGMLVWDGPKGRGVVGQDPRPEHHYVMQPGDALVLDRLVWHHGLPITKGHRYVVVNFYSVSWKKLKGGN